MGTRGNVLQKATPTRRGAGAVIKPVMAAPELLDRLQAERSANRSAWARVTETSPATSSGS
jgi:hypothetical protein